MWKKNIPEILSFASNFHNCVNPKTLTRFCSLMAVVDKIVFLFWISAQWRKAKEDGYLTTNFRL
jgi:hypothetical protein